MISSDLELKTLTTMLIYEFTASILVAFAVVGPLLDYSGDAFSCNLIDGVHLDSLNVRCEIYLEIRTQVREQENAVYLHDEYILFSVLLIFESILFLTPKFFWKTCEDGLMNKLTSGLENRILDQKYKKKEIRLMVKYMIKHIGKHDSYFAMYMVYKMLILIIVFLQMCFVHLFLGGNIFGYGFDFVELKWEESITDNQMVRLFPLRANCSYTGSDSSGLLQKRNILCELHVNIWNERHYVFFCYWLYILFVFTILNMVVDIHWIATKPIHSRVLIWRRRDMIRTGIIKEFIESKGGIGDYFVLSLLELNIHRIIFREFMKELYKYICDLNLDELVLQLAAECDRRGNFG